MLMHHINVLTTGPQRSSSYTEVIPLILHIRHVSSFIYYFYCVTLFSIVFMFGFVHFRDRAVHYMIKAIEIGISTH